MWFNHRFPGFALTVEYGARPSRTEAPGRAATGSCGLLRRLRAAADRAPRRALSGPRRPASPWRRTPRRRRRGRRWRRCSVICVDSNASASSKACPAAYATDCRIAPRATVGPGGEAGGQVGDGLGELAGRYDARGQAERQRLVGRDRAREVEQLDRLGPADQPLQRQARAGVAGQRDVGEGQVEAGGVGHDPQVAGEGQARAGAGGDAVDRGDHRLRPCRPASVTIGL